MNIAHVHALLTVGQLKYILHLQVTSSRHEGNRPLTGREAAERRLVSPQKQAAIAAFLPVVQARAAKAAVPFTTAAKPAAAASCAAQAQGARKQKSWHAVSDDDVNRLWPSQWQSSKPPAASQATHT